MAVNQGTEERLLPEERRDRDRAAAGTADPGGGSARGVVTLLLCAALAVSLGVCFRLSGELRSAQGELAQERHRGLELEDALASYGDALESLEDRNALLEEAEADLAARLDFWESRAVMVTESGERYHTSQCSVLRPGTRYLIYNVEWARLRGYTPCELCTPPAAEWEGRATRYGTVPQGEGE